VGTHGKHDRGEEEEPEAGMRSRGSEGQSEEKGKLLVERCLPLMDLFSA